MARVAKPKQNSWLNLVDTVRTFKYEELMELNHFVCDRMRRMSEDEVLKFRVGQEVHFTSPRRGTFTGKVTKLGRKKVYVSTGLTTWRVPAGLLKVGKAS